MSEKTIAVIGAGPAGLTAAYQLALKGIRVKVYEAVHATARLAAIPQAQAYQGFGPAVVFRRCFPSPPVSCPNRDHFWTPAVTGTVTEKLVPFLGRRGGLFSAGRGPRKGTRRVRPRARLGYTCITNPT